MRYEKMLLIVKKKPAYFRLLFHALGLAALYPLLVLLTPLLGLPPLIAWLYWGIVKLILAYALIEGYRLTGLKRVAMVGVLLAVSGLLTFLPIWEPLIDALEVVSVAGLSLFLFDVGRAYPLLGLEIPAGMLFVGIVLMMLPDPTVGFVGLLLLLFGLTLSAVAARKGASLRMR